MSLRCICFRYEGTGRSLSLKLVSHLEKQSHNPATGVISGNSGSSLFFLAVESFRMMFLFCISFPLEEMLLGWINVISETVGQVNEIRDSTLNSQNYQGFTKSSPLCLNLLI